MYVAVQPMRSLHAMLTVLQVSSATPYPCESAHPLPNSASSARPPPDVQTAMAARLPNAPIPCWTNTDKTTLKNKQAVGREAHSSKPPNPVTWPLPPSSKMIAVRSSKHAPSIRRIAR